MARTILLYPLWVAAAALGELFMLGERIGFLRPAAEAEGRPEDYDAICGLKRAHLPSLPSPERIG